MPGKRAAVRGLVFALLGVLVLVVAGATALYFSRVPLRGYARTWDLKIRHPGEVRLLVVGDTGSGDDNQRAVAAAMEQRCLIEQPDAVVLLGDNFYMNGVQDVQDAQWQSKFSEIYGQPCLSATPFAAVLGNHDYHGNPQAQVDYSRTSAGRWIMPARAFVLRAPGILNIAMIDSNFPDRCFFEFCSLDRVLVDLVQQPAPWTLVAGHHPLFSGGKYRKMKPFRRQLVGGVYCAAGASMYWSGHDHNLQFLHGQDGDLPCDVNQLIIGGGGAALYPAQFLPGQSEFAQSMHGFAFARIRADSLHMDVYGVQGPSDGLGNQTPLHSMTLTK